MVDLYLRVNKWNVHICLDTGVKSWWPRHGSTVASDIKWGQRLGPPRRHHEDVHLPTIVFGKAIKLLCHFIVEHFAFVIHSTTSLAYTHFNEPTTLTSWETNRFTKHKFTLQTVINEDIGGNFMPTQHILFQWFQSMLWHRSAKQPACQAEIAQRQVWLLLVTSPPLLA